MNLDNKKIQGESPMLRYCKTILLKVSFSRRLQLKEFRKSLRWLSYHEWLELKIWLRNYTRNSI